MGGMLAFCGWLWHNFVSNQTEWVSKEVREHRFGFWPCRSKGASAKQRDLPVCYRAGQNASQRLSEEAILAVCPTFLTVVGFKQQSLVLYRSLCYFSVYFGKILPCFGNKLFIWCCGEVPTQTGMSICSARTDGLLILTRNPLMVGFVPHCRPPGVLLVYISYFSYSSI